MVKGEALSPPAGRADDFAWPRREVGHEQSKADTPVAANTPSDGAGTASPAVAGSAAASPKPAKKPPAAPVQARPPAMRDFFGFGSPPPRPLAPSPRGTGIPRPPGTIGRSASMPDYPTR
jgi:hypothetical protein